MAAEGVLVFDDGPVTITSQGEFGQAFVVLDESNDVLVFDADVVRQVDDSATSSVDFIIFDAQVTVTETVVAPADFILVDPPKQETRVVLDGPEHQDVMVITAGGPPGRQGDPGLPGPQGLPGIAGAGAYYQDFGFASPSSTWTIVHNQNSLGLNVETVDTNGDPVEGYVRFVDPNVIEVDWYYPTAGVARVFR